MKISLEILLLIVMVIILGYIFFQFADKLLAPSTSQSVNNNIFFGKNCFSVEIAKTNLERERGLMYRKQLDKDKGMFFIFEEEGLYPFWMKNTLIPLDIIWINANNKVVFIGQNVQPCKSLICPLTNTSVVAKYVLEINANISKKIGIKVGDIVDININ